MYVRVFFFIDLTERMDETRFTVYEAQIELEGVYLEVCNTKLVTYSGKVRVRSVRNQRSCIKGLMEPLLLLLPLPTSHRVGYMRELIFLLKSSSYILIN